MKTNKLIGLAIVTATLALFTATATAGNFLTQQYAVDANLTNAINTAGNAGICTSNSTAGTAFAIPQNVPWSLMVENTCLSNNVNSGAQNGTSNTVYGWNLSQDGTHYTTTLPLKLTLTQNGTNRVCAATNFVPTAWAGYQYGRLDQVTTGNTNNTPTYFYQVGSFQ